METESPYWLDPARIDADMPPETRAALGIPSSSLEYTETSVPREIPVDYREFRSIHQTRELQATKETLEQILGTSDHPRMARLLSCRKHAHFYRQKSTGKVKVLASACRDRWCPFCGSARSGEISTQVQEWLGKVHHPRFLTVTLRSSNAPLSEQINAIYNAFRKFRLDPLVAPHLKAGIWCFQVTYNVERCQWHPHIHALIIGQYASQVWLSERWKKASHGSFVVDIRSVRNAKEEAGYVARYAARPARLSDLPEQVRAEAVNAFHGRRLFGTWGKPPEGVKITKTKMDMTDWQWLASWREVIETMSFDTRMFTIWAAWRDQLEILPEFVPPDPDIQVRPIPVVKPTENGFKFYPGENP